MKISTIIIISIIIIIIFYVIIRKQNEDLRLKQESIKNLENINSLTSTSYQDKGIISQITNSQFITNVSGIFGYVWGKII